MARKMAVFCDETGTHNCAYFGWGSVWCPLERVDELQRAVDRICRHKRRRRELKWSHTGSAHARKRVMKWFFQTPWVCFQSLWVKKGAMRIFNGRGSKPVAYRKLLCTMLVTCMERFNRLPGGPREFEVVVDEVGQTTRSLTRREFRILTAASTKRTSLEQSPVDAFRRVDSQQSRGIQIADLFAGAIRASWEGSPSGCKAKMRDVIVNHLGWTDLRGTTPPNLKFNVWLHRACVDSSTHLDRRKLSLHRPGGDPQPLFDAL